MTILRYWSHGLVNSFTKQTNMYPHMGNAKIHSSEHVLQDEEMRTLINAMAAKIEAERVEKGILARLFLQPCEISLVKRLS